MNRSSYAYHYDSAGQIKNVVVNTAIPATTNATVSSSHAYYYDLNGNRTSVLDTGLTTNYSSNNVNAYTSITGSTAPTYDLNGNMLTGPVEGMASTLVYDKEHARRLLGRADCTECSPERGDFSVLGKNHQNRLRSITRNSVSTSHRYDALGRIIETSSNASTNNIERYTWSGWTLLSRELFTGTTATTAFRYTWGLDLSGSIEGAGGVGGLLAIERNVAGSSTWDIRFPHCDANGNIIALTNSGGNVSARYRYDAFGKTIQATDVDGSGWVSHNIHGFSSKPTFGGTGLLYYGFRWYSPTLGRWINRDPIEEKGGMNLYGFVGNDGLNQWDAHGQASCLTELLDLIDDPEKWVQDFLFEKLVKRFPAIKAVELWTELMQAIIEEVNTNLKDIKKQIEKSGMSSDKMCCVEKYLNEYDRSLIDLNGKDESDKELLREAMEACECYGKDGGIHPLRSTFFWDVSGMAEGIGDGAKKFVIDEMVDNIQEKINDGIGKKYPDVPFRELISTILEQYVKALGEDIKCAVGACSESEK